MATTRRLWLGLAALLVSSFGVLLWMGNDIYQQAPPVPERVVSVNGSSLNWSTRNGAGANDEFVS